MTARAPTHLSRAGKQKWRELLPILEQRGDADQAELDLLAAYSFAWQQWLSADTEESQIRWIRVLRQTGAVLRLTPRSRTAKPKDTRDPLLRILGNSKTA